jgi:hypothetical protein
VKIETVATKAPIRPFGHGRSTVPRKAATIKIGPGIACVAP